MSYRMQTDGIADLIKTFKELDDKAEFIACMALYDGAAVIADAVTQEAKKIKTEPFHYAAVDGATKRRPSPEEKEIVTAQGAAGIAKFRKNLGAVDTSVGYNGAGYAPVKWNHMSSKARTNYKDVSFKGNSISASSTLKWLRDHGGSAKHGISKDIGRGKQDMKPIGVIANAINSGTSFMYKDPFVRRAFNKSRKTAEKVIIDQAQKLIEKIIKQDTLGGKSA